MKSEACILVVKRDSTEFRLWPHGHRSPTENVFARCVIAFGLDSSRYSPAPGFSRVSCKSYRGIASGVDIESLNINERVRRNPRPKFVIFAMVNRLVNRESISRVISALAVLYNILQYFHLRRY